MATRMQQRRGTAAQWISTNNGDGPVLEVGEIGFETDTGKFKIGDGINPWVDLDYFLDESDIDGITGDYVLANTLGQANGVATLDSSGKLTGSQIPGIDELAQDAVDLALVAGTGISKTYNDNANTITIAVDTTAIQARVADVSDTEIGYLANVTSDIQTQLNSKASSTDLSNHASDTTDVHGIANTAELATKEFAANLLVNASKTNITITGNKDGLTITAENGVADSTTSDLAEGTNLYFTNERAQDAVGNVVGTGLAYDDNTGAISTNNVPNSSLANSAVTINGFSISLGGSASYSSDNIGEGTTNLYFTNTRARAAVDGGTGLDYNSSTGVFDIDSTVTTNTGNQTLTNKSIDLANNTVTGTVAQFNSALSDANFVTTSDTGTVTSTMIADGTIVDGDINASAAIAQSKIANLTTDLGNKQDKVSGVSDTEIGYLDGVTSNVQAQLNSKAALAGAAFTGNISTTGDLQVDGNFTVNGSNVLVSATQIQIEDSIIQLAHQNAANTVDLGLVAGYNDGTAKHAGLVKDTSDAKWKLFKGVTDEPTTTVNFAQATLDDLAVGGLEATSFSVGTVSNTEIGYLDGVTSNVQAQLNAKAPLASPTFTGTVTVPNGASLGTPTSITLTNATGLPVSTGISGLGTGVATFLATPSSANLASAVTDETGSGSLVFSTAPTLTNAVEVNSILRGPEERWSVSATAATGTVNLDVLTSGILYYTTNASGNWTLNIRGDASTTLNNSLTTNDSITVVFFVTNGATPYYQTGFTIDGVSVTPKWQNGTAPSAGNANSIDIYSYTIVKTAASTYTAFGSQTRFA